jgi:SAM-dependent methyltransferase
MSGQSGFQVSGSAAELYERYAVRYFIGPWAPGLVALASLQFGERVLDLACGTGVVARIAASKVESGHVTGLDINAGMLELTRFRGHPIVGAERKVHDAEEPSAVPAGVPAADRRADP